SRQIYQLVVSLISSVFRIKGQRHYLQLLLNPYGGGTRGGKTRGSGSFTRGGKGSQYGIFSIFSASSLETYVFLSFFLPDRAGRNIGDMLKPIDWDQENLRPLQKNFYRQHKAVSARNEYDINLWYQENQVTLEGKEIPRPVFEFAEANFPGEIANILYANFQKPTTIQSISWPIAMSGRDIVSIAKTGSGKTLSFILPGIMHTLGQPPRSHHEGPSVLVLLPTRELAQQVQEVAKDYCAAMGLSLTCLFGGSPKVTQARDLKKGVDIVIATPGRLNDFLEVRATSLRRCSYLVLDEADRMLDMGFEPQIRKIVSQIRPDRQTLMFSATWPKEVHNLARDFLIDPAKLTVGSLELAANHNITQVVEVMNESGKQRRLMTLLNDIMNQPECKTLIFVETKRKADNLTRFMRRDGWPALCIHGDKGQSEREWALSEFKTGKVPILLATDVAARGLDVDDIKFVINYDYSNNSEDYVHRIGRTGRCEKKGTAYTFFTPDNASKARDLIKVMEEANQTVPDALYEIAKSYNSYSNNDYYGAKRPRFDNFGSRQNGGRYEPW
ncbi:unnamed protein product, partial [Enterobius vermicularis]|uniref:RNA helicase n=1 Tax=Enterobius vermicularis TaxID=51028 RepID=A0A0N4V447_ENTVE